MKLTVLTDNNTYIDQYFLGEPAVCYLLEDGDEQLLFDLGYSDVYWKNAKAMGLDLGKVGTLAFSHGHNDHTGGLAHLPQELSGCLLVGHPNLLEPKRGGGFPISAPVSAEELRGRFQLRLSREAQKLSEHIWFLGEMPRHFPFENQKAVGIRYVRGQWKPDYVLDDSALALQLQSGIFIVTGCSHAGICNITRYAKQVTGCSRVLGVIGGFHLFDEDAEQTAQTAVFFKREGLTQFYPCHCTSLLAKLRLAEELPLREVGVGLQLCWDDADGTLREVRGMTE